MIAEEAEFFSFGTNDLTQTTFGISRDDAGALPAGLHGRRASSSRTRSSRSTRRASASWSHRRRARPGDAPGIKLGICGEHGGDPASIASARKVGLDYVSCSPYRVPIAGWRRRTPRWKTPAPTAATASRRTARPRPASRSPRWRSASPCFLNPRRGRVLIGIAPPPEPGLHRSCGGASGRDAWENRRATERSAGRGAGATKPRGRSSARPARDGPPPPGLRGARHRRPRVRSGFFRGEARDYRPGRLAPLRRRSPQWRRAAVARRLGERHGSWERKDASPRRGVVRTPPPRAGRRGEHEPALEGGGVRRPPFHRLPHEHPQPRVRNGAGQLVPRQRIRHHDSGAPRRLPQPPPDARPGRARARAKARRGLPGVRHPGRDRGWLLSAHRRIRRAPRRGGGRSVRPLGRREGRRREAARTARRLDHDPSAPLADGERHHLAAARGPARHQRGHAPLPARLRGPHPAAARPGGQPARIEQRPAGGAPLPLELPHERSGEGADDDRHDLHSAQLHRRRLRDELRSEGVAVEPAGAGVALRLPDGAAFHGRLFRGDALLLLAQGVAPFARTRPGDTPKIPVQPVPHREGDPATTPAPAMQAAKK
jgi:hypothetical protein